MIFLAFLRSLTHLPPGKIPTRLPRCSLRRDQHSTRASLTAEHRPTPRRAKSPRQPPAQPRLLHRRAATGVTARLPLSITPELEQQS